MCCDRNFIEDDLINSRLKVVPVIKVASIKKTNKLINGYYERFLPSYIETFGLDSKDNLQSYKDYLKISYALKEIYEFIDIFVNDSITDLDKSIITVNVNSLKLLCDERVKQSLKRFEKGDIDG